MKHYQYRIKGEPVVIHAVEHTEDLDGFRTFVRRNLKCLSADSETTGLDTYSATNRLRLVQFGTPAEAWVIPVEHGGEFAEDVRRTLRAVKRMVIHNASFDLQVWDRHLGVRLEELWPKVLDTKVLSHLIDPRGQDEGGTGQSLEALTARYIDSQTADEAKGLMTRLAKEHKTTKNRIWSLIDVDHPDYVLYAGMDTILAARLARMLAPLVPVSARPLIRYEHEVAEACSVMERNGFLLDVDYALGLSARLQGEEQAAREIAAGLGCDNANSTEQVANALEARGVTISGRTEKGKRKVDKVLLERLAGQGDELARAVIDAKKAAKWRSTWVDKFLANMDSDGRCHASINSLRARTARMSITGIPAQTLPSGDWKIRRCFVADVGHLIASVDYQTQELRVLAALSKDRRMRAAFAAGADLHQITADAAEVARGVGKATNFTYVYGGGAKAVAETAGVPVAVARKVIAGFEKSYPQVAGYSLRLQHIAARQGYITTPTGRRLPVDRSRAYSALNYMVQSTSRDVTCRGILRLYKGGYGPYLRLPIHDEVVASIPAHKSAWGAAEIGHLMAEDMDGVHIGTDPEVTGFSWGHGYMDEEERLLHVR
ncbi:DNA polymerase [Kutzneria chonburiensis]|uniref:DNA polymerase I n=1 Tax=Kutzneria chonburiensis TaxID=1483604 RepID=A0ABV6N4S4_9PSEU|nr:DNA polymerase [Kutzneria chonburiensis]